MGKKPIGLVLKGFINDKNLSADQVAKLIGKSKQQVYNDFNRVGMKDDEIERYANALQIEKQAIYEKLEAGDAGNNAGAGSYLLEHITKLEQQFFEAIQHSKEVVSQMQDQLAVKDRQIERLLDILGKLDPAPVMSKEMPLFLELQAAS